MKCYLVKDVASQPLCKNSLFDVIRTISKWTLKDVTRGVYNQKESQGLGKNQLQVI